ncbi:hypothetical protein ACLOJK_021306 [Asimina triloba]
MRISLSLKVDLVSFGIVSQDVVDSEKGTVGEKEEEGPSIVGKGKDPLVSYAFAGGFKICKGFKEAIWRSSLHKGFSSFKHLFTQLIHMAKVEADACKAASQVNEQELGRARLELAKAQEEVANLRKDLQARDVVVTEVQEDYNVLNVRVKVVYESGAPSSFVMVISSKETGAAAVGKEVAPFEAGPLTVVSLRDTSSRWILKVRTEVDMSKLSYGELEDQLGHQLQVGLHGRVFGFICSIDLIHN